MEVWFLLTFLSVLFVTYDLAVNTPAVGVMKVAWVLVVLYTGPVGLFLYLVSCRQPLPGTHEEFIRPMWKQALGSEVHCLAGDATGIILAAVAVSFFAVSMGVEVAIEYVAGFAFGLLIFQALFMKGMMGGSYWGAVKGTFLPEWLSMNFIMAGMIPAMVIWTKLDPRAADPTTLQFWGKMALASIVGGVVAYPINYWLVKNGLKHGMVTAGVRPAHHHGNHVSAAAKGAMLALSLAALAVGIFLAKIF